MTEFSAYIVLSTVFHLNLQFTKVSTIFSYKGSVCTAVEETMHFTSGQLLNAVVWHSCSPTQWL